MNIFKMDFKRNLRSLIVWSVISAGLICAFMLLYPTMKNNAVLELAKAKLDAMPKELVEAFHMAQVDFTQITEFFGFTLQFLLTATCIYGAVLGVGVLLREENEKTIEFLYARPVKRAQIFASKLMAAVVSYVVYFAIFGAAGILVSVCVKPPEVDMMVMVSTLKSVLLGGLIAGLTYLFMGILISVFFRKTIHTALLALGIFFVTSILGGIPDALGILEFLHWISPIAYFVPKQIIQSGLDTGNVLICLGVMAVCTIIAYGVYRKKDFAV